MLQFHVDDSRCIHCLICVADCPSRIIEGRRDTLPSIVAGKEDACIHCQHCLAVCPTGAISIFGRNPDDSLSLTQDVLPSYAQMSRLLRGRRSVRQYKDENVDPALLHELLTTLANGPTGVNRSELTLHVIADKAVMARFQDQVMAGLSAAVEEGRMPARYAYLQAALSWRRDYAVKFLFRNAPHLLIVSAPPDAPCPAQDVALTLANFDLLAQSAGLGSVWWGMMMMVLDIVPTLKTFLDLPADHLCYGMLFGIPAVQYHRTVQRDDGAIIKTIQ
jgi:nitroreductase/Pyruvate/2-oxoacid:ferredoxin oxidoreductase delta subunit